MNSPDIDIRQTVHQSITAVAPDADPEQLGPDDSIRERLGLDSMDFLEIVTQIEERTGLSIPERDYAKVQTLADMVAYLEENRR